MVNISKNILDHAQEHSGQGGHLPGFNKWYMKRYLERLQDEAINHITNYVIVKNMEHSMVSSHNPEGVNNRQ
ncbi:GD19209 [Drosophila simulans]|uniref:GD19209 n=1 Tax=Drosophila simulans TaxID=7240 RepID=B4NVI9_DROSI|nr:GD19209 [Drosophila simulans]